jgi:hypothetical protein
MEEVHDLLLLRSEWLHARLLASHQRGRKRRRLAIETAQDGLVLQDDGPAVGGHLNDVLAFELSE